MLPKLRLLWFAFALSQWFVWCKLCPQCHGFGNGGTYLSSGSLAIGHWGALHLEGIKVALLGPWLDLPRVLL